MNAEVFGRLYFPLKLEVPHTAVNVYPLECVFDHVPGFIFVISCPRPPFTFNLRGA